VRFRDYDTMARLALAGALASSVAFLLPWALVRQGASTHVFGGLSLVIAPAVLRELRTPGLEVGSAFVALGAGIALIAALGDLLLALEPGLRPYAQFNPAAGRKLAFAGLATAALAIAAFEAVVGPAVGLTTLEPAALLTLVGFALSIYAWPRAQLLGEEPDADHGSTGGRTADGLR
jgi:hypothetical protein